MNKANDLIKVSKRGEREKKQHERERMSEFNKFSINMQQKKIKN